LYKHHHRQHIIIIKREREHSSRTREINHHISMKIKTLQRDHGASTERECSGDLRRMARNLNPTYHPMQRAREYTRAVTAAKMERMFAQPLIAGNLRGAGAHGHGHMDAVTCSAISRKSLFPAQPMDKYSYGIWPREHPWPFVWKVRIDGP
jgi:hypothetical protein